LQASPTWSGKDCVPSDAARQESFEADKLNQLMGK
jgi:hypothetical protein